MSLFNVILTALFIIGCGSVAVAAWLGFKGLGPNITTPTGVVSIQIPLWVGMLIVGLAAIGFSGYLASSQPAGSALPTSGSSASTPPATPAPTGQSSTTSAAPGTPQVTPKTSEAPSASVSETPPTSTAAQEATPAVYGVNVNAGQQVPQCLRLKGSAKGIDRGDDLWAVVQTPNPKNKRGTYYVLRKISVGQDGRWSTVVGVGDEAATGRPYWVQVYAVDREIWKGEAEGPLDNLNELSEAFKTPALLDVPVFRARSASSSC